MSIKETLDINENLHFENNLYYQKHLSHGGAFERLYLKLREKENRLYTEDLVKRFPEIPSDHPLHTEWAIRKFSLERLVGYLKEKKEATRILEVGCGNGWLSNYLIQNLPMEVCGLDVNEFELKQASNLFINARLSFVYANVWEKVLLPAAFDFIILASSVQYFPDLKLLVTRLQELVAEKGEIHILDSPLYRSTQESEAARLRSHKYFTSLGFPQMTDNYFHHTIHALSDFNFTVLYNPKSLTSCFRNRILRSPQSPFPWIRILSR